MNTPKITITDIEELLAKMHFKVHQENDNEDAHGIEDMIHLETLKAIASGHPDSAELARTALKTQQIDYDRWYG